MAYNIDCWLVEKLLGLRLTLVIPIYYIRVRSMENFVTLAFLTPLEIRDRSRKK